jgi:hypothetical protein
MTKSVEAIAGIYRRHGWEKQASELEEDVQRFKAEGMPEHFEMDVQEEEKQEPAQALMRQLVEILAAETLDSNKSKSETYLTPELAAKLNPIGQKFEDSTPLSALSIKTRGTNDEFFIPGQPTSGAEQTYKIDVRFVKSYNKLINGLQRKGSKTVGDIRNSDPRALYKELQQRDQLKLGGYQSLYFSEKGIQFLKNALVRFPQTRMTRAMRYNIS